MKPLIYIATPYNELVHGLYTYDLASLLYHCNNNGLEVDYIQSPNCTVLPNSRNALCDIAIRNGGTHILFCDSDMRFPPDGLARLLSHDLPVVGANYRQRIIPRPWTAQIGGTPVDSLGATGLQEVSLIGMGFTLIDLALTNLANLPPPWFSTPWCETPRGYQHITDDTHFCNLMQQNGTPIHIDHDLSQHVFHLGTEQIGPNDPGTILHRAMTQGLIGQAEAAACSPAPSTPTSLPEKVEG